MEQIHARNNRLFALLVFAITAIAYFFTMAPTVAFWDCGEYIAAGASLGVPHPPGNILFMTMFRVASMLFSFFKDIGYRMNFLVLLFSSATAMVVYLIEHQQWTGVHEPKLLYHHNKYQTNRDLCGEVS